jgi:predicted ATPase
MRYIARTKISGFKSIREISYKGRYDTEKGLPLGDLNVLIGANGAGKSNFLSFFQLLRTIVEDDSSKEEKDREKDREDRLRLYAGKSGGAGHLIYFGTGARREITADIWLEEDSRPPVQLILSYRFKLAPTDDDNLVFDFEECFSAFPSSGFHVSAGGGPRATALFDHNEASDQIRDRFQRMAPIRIYRFPDASGASPARRVSDLDDNRYLRPEGENIAAFLYLLKSKHPSSYRGIVDVVRLVFPFFEDFQLAPLELDERKIKLEWKESGEDSYRDVSYLSEGTLRFICLATLLLQPRPPGLMLIDEPELGLHPYAIGVLTDLLRAAAHDSQLIVSTQSVTLVNQLGPEDIIVVERQKEIDSARYETVFKRLEKTSLDRWLEDYGMGDLWEKNLIGGRP